MAVVEMQNMETLSKKDKVFYEEFRKKLKLQASNTRGISELTFIVECYRNGVMSVTSKIDSFFSIRIEQPTVYWTNKKELELKVGMIVEDTIDNTKKSLTRKTEEDSIKGRSVGSCIYEVVENVEEKSDNNGNVIRKRTYEVVKLPVLAVVRDAREDIDTVLVCTTKEYEQGTGKQKKAIKEQTIKSIELENVVFSLCNDRDKQGMFFNTKELAIQVAACRREEISGYCSSFVYNWGNITLGGVGKGK